MDAIRKVQKKYTWKRTAATLFEAMINSSNSMLGHQPSCELAVEVNDLNSPASYLAERLLGQLSKVYRVELILHEKRRVVAPLFLPYYDNRPNSGNNLRITIGDVRGILRIRPRSSKVYVTVHSSERTSAKYSTRRTTLDKMLELDEWQYQADAQLWQVGI